MSGRKMGFILNEDLPRRPFGHTDKGIPQSLKSICVIYVGLWTSLCNTMYATNLKSVIFALVLFQIQDGSWHQSRFFFYTQDSRQLPIVDIQQHPTPQRHSQQRVEIGPVCFLWQQHHRGANLCSRTTLLQGWKAAASHQRACRRLLGTLTRSNDGAARQLHVCRRSRPQWL